MKIELNAEEYQELQNLIEIFESMFFDGKEVFAFAKIKEFVDQGTDINEVDKAVKEEIKWQLEEGFDWVESFQVCKVKEFGKGYQKEMEETESSCLWNVMCKDKLLSYF